VNVSYLLASSLAGSRLSRRSFLTSLASAGLLLCVAPSCPQKAPTAAPARQSVVLRWNDALLDAIRATKMPGPISNRALAIVHTAVYDAWTPYTEVPSRLRRLLSAAQRASGRYTTRARGQATRPIAPL
jgi:hypothetical protein